MAGQEGRATRGDQSHNTGHTLARGGPEATGAGAHPKDLFYRRKGLAIVVAVAVISGMAGVAVAFSVTTLDAERISLFQKGTDASHFSVETHELGFQGPMRVSFTVTLTNTDSDPQAANVTAQALDADQNLVLEQTKSTGEVAGGASVTLIFIFVKPGLADDFEGTFLVVRDLD